MADYGDISVGEASVAKKSLKVSKESKPLKGITYIDSTLRVKQKDLLIFLRQLSVVLRSGIALAQGLDLLAENMTNKKLAYCVSRTSVRLSAGEELSVSLKRYPLIFLPIMIGLIQAGEAGGILDQVLDRIATLLEERDKIKGQIVGALIYPILVFVLAVVVGLGLLIFIVPRFKEMFDNMGADLPALTSFMLAVSSVVTSPYFAICAPLSIGFGLFYFKKYYSTEEGLIYIDALILKIPLFGDLIIKSEMASMCDTLSTLVNAGIPIVEGLDRCISASSNEIIRRAIRKSISLVRQGQSLHYSLSRTSVLPKLVTSMIRIGEETGQLSFMLENLSLFYKREVESQVSTLTKAMEPAVIFVVAIIVGTIVISLYLPMFSLIQNMSK